jgi:hypothetical protein
MSGPSDEAITRAHAAALAELRGTPVATSWRRHAAVVAVVLAGIGVAAVAAAFLASLAGAADVVARAPMLAALLAVAVAGGVASQAPGARRWTAVATGGALVTMAWLVVSRGAGTPSATAEWVCSVSHVAVGLLPLAVGLGSLRHSAWNRRRALATGLGAGTAGALLGELACHQGARHVLVHHVGAWLLVAIACVAISRRLRPRTFAP